MIKHSMRPCKFPQRGNYLILGAFGLVILLMAAALAVDVSRKFSLEQKAQDVADAAALAGAQQLPNVALARLQCTTYIQSAAGSWYVPPDTDITIFVSDDNRSGSVAVVVRGSWDPVLLPAWLFGDENYDISRFAIAAMTLETSVKVTYENGTLDSPPSGPYALFIGDTDAGSSQFGEPGANQITIVGNAHFNHCADIGGQNHVDSQGVFEAQCLEGDVAELEGQKDGSSPYAVPPILNAAAMVSDILLDISVGAQAAYYTLNTYKPLLAKNGSVVYMDDGSSPVEAKWDGSQWTVRTGNKTVAPNAGFNTGMGNGIDLEVAGDLVLELPNSAGKFWQGSVRSTGKMSMGANNSEIRCVQKGDAVAGLDNAGLALHSGSGLPDNSLAFDNAGNAVNVYGVLYVEGSLLWTGNMSAAGTIGTPGDYNATGNGFIKGMVYADDLSPANGGGLGGNNLKIYYDAEMISGLEITNAVTRTPPKYSNPTVWLMR